MDEADINVILGSLLGVADPFSKTVISAYKPNVTHNTNVTKISSQKFSMNTLETCADFLNIQVKGDNDIALFSNKPTIADRIILAIEALFPALCDGCDSYYNNEFDKEDDDIPYHCYACFQGSHNCSQIKDKLIETKDYPVGFVWLCHGCKAKINPMKPPKRSRSTSINQTPSVPGTPPVSVDTPKLDRPPFKNEVLQKRLAGLDQKKDPNPKEGENNEGADKNTQKVCPRYKARRCPHGRDGQTEIEGKPCPFSHPKICRRYSSYGTHPRYGCRRGKDCFYYHPRLCRNSTQNKHCAVEGCTFTHLKGTMRGLEIREVPKEPEMLSTQIRGHTTDRRREEGTRPYRPVAASNSPSSSNTDNNNFLQLMGLVNTMQETFRQEIASLKSSLSNISLASQSNPADQSKVHSQFLPAQVPMFPSQVGSLMPNWMPAPSQTNFQPHCY